MTLLRMAAAYRQNAGLLRPRIIALRDQSREASPSERAALDRRIHTLNTMYREAQDTALMLERYYERRESDGQRAV